MQSKQKVEKVFPFICSNKGTLQLVTSQRPKYDLLAEKALLQKIIGVFLFKMLHVIFVLQVDFMGRDFIYLVTLGTR